LATSDSNPAGQIEIVRHSTLPDRRWDDLVIGDHSPWQARWALEIQRRFGNETVVFEARAGGRVVGGAAVYFVGSRKFPGLDRILGRVAHVPDEPALLGEDEAALAALVTAIEREVERGRAVEVEWRAELPRRLQPERLKDRGYTVEPYGVGVLELPRDPAAVDRLLQPPARRQVKKALRLGVRVETTADLSRLLKLLDRSFERAGLAPRNRMFVQCLQELCDAEILVASHEGIDIAALLWARFGDLAVNIFHGRADGDTHGASNLLHQQLYARAIETGARRLHTGGMALPGETDARFLGITRFKEKMGFTCREAWRARRTPRPGAAALRKALLRLWLRRFVGADGLQ
jgi:hypothetical protein